MFSRSAYALALCVAFAVSSSGAEGFRWKIDEVNEVARPDLPRSTHLGGIAWVSNDTYMAVSDWDANVWELSLPYDRNDGRILSCAMKPLGDLESAKDVEGLALDPFDGSAWIADEINSTIRRYSPVTGRLLAGNVSVPQILKKFYRDSGLESLTIRSDGLSMWTCTEEAVKPDGSRANRKTGSDVRLVRFDRSSPKDSWKMSGQWVYRTDSIAGGPWYSGKKRDISRSGISELCVLDDGTLLVLEREFSVVIIPRLRCRIYETDFSGAVDVKSKENLSSLGENGRVRKRLLYESTGFSMYEGMCVGPVLKDGSRMLVLVSDADKKSFHSVMSLRLSKIGAKR